MEVENASFKLRGALMWPCANRSKLRRSNSWRMWQHTAVVALRRYTFMSAWLADIHDCKLKRAGGTIGSTENTLMSTLGAPWKVIKSCQGSKIYPAKHEHLFFQFQFHSCGMASGSVSCFSYSFPRHYDRIGSLPAWNLTIILDTSETMMALALYLARRRS